MNIIRNSPRILLYIMVSAIMLAIMIMFYVVDPAETNIKIQNDRTNDLIKKIRQFK